MRRLGLLIRALVLLFATILVLSGGVSAQDSQWRSYGGDDGRSTKYAPLDQIDATNVGRLTIAWRRAAVDPRLPVPGYAGFGFQSTPLKVGEVLFASNTIGLVEAFDAGTGRTVWVQEPLEGTEQPLRGRGARGVAYWADGSDERIFAVRGTLLHALNATTGEPESGFGVGGAVSLKRAATEDRYYWNSPPAVAGDVVIVGSSSSDNQPTKEGTAGDVRAFDVRTGALRWTFHVIPHPGEYGEETWENDSNTYSGGANVWMPFTVDQETGYVYLETSTPTGDWYGAHRPGDNLFAESLVCIDGRTGERIWHFQAVHHGLWDYDNPAAPILGDITVEGRTIRAVMLVTKQGFVFTFDRMTGEPVWPIEERSVPSSTAPGERASETQPFPTKPAPFERQGIGTEDLIDFSPEMRAEAVEFVSQYTIGPLFTPPTVVTETNKGTLGLPSWAGGANWGGGAFDPETGLLYIPSVTAPFKFSLIKADPESDMWVRGPGDYIVGPGGLPLVKPPYGRITAIDMNRGEHVWMIANGDGPRDHELLQHLDLPPLGQGGRVAPLATKTLLFVGEGDEIIVSTPPFGGGNRFRAFDKKTGDVVWEIELPAGVTSAPMTYMHEGKQYIVVAIQGREHAPEFVALSLD